MDLKAVHPDPCYVASEPWVEANHPNIRKLAGNFDSAREAYRFVRDDIRHSYDIGAQSAPGTASEVLEAGHGICFAKAHLLCALLRAMGIPSGLAYQRLLLGETPEEGYCLHGFNTIFDAARGVWLRADARGNKRGISAEYPGTVEKLAFLVRPELGELEYSANFAAPPRQIREYYTGYAASVDISSRELPEALDSID